MNGYITLDYELAMGNKTGTPEMCLFVPMNHLTTMLDKHGAKLNVFVDAAYLLQMKKLKNDYPQLQKDYEAVTNHVRKLDANGHAIQLHLHPQWCYSHYDGNKWVLDKNHYKLSDMPLKEQKRLIHDGAQLLNSLVNRKVTAFRAGGYSIENFPELYDTFLEEGIVADSSVLRGEQYKSKYQTYDYRNIPKKSSYKFSKNHKIEDVSGKMTEYPLSVKITPFIVNITNSLLYRIRNRQKWNAIKNKWGDGIGIGFPGGTKQKVLIYLKRLVGKKSIVAYVEYGMVLESVYSYAPKHFQGDDFVIIGHPKCLSPYTIECLDKFISNHPEIDFRLM